MTVRTAATRIDLSRYTNAMVEALLTGEFDIIHMTADQCSVVCAELGVVPKDDGWFDLFPAKLPDADQFRESRTYDGDILMDLAELETTGAADWTASANHLRRAAAVKERP